MSIEDIEKLKQEIEIEDKRVNEAKASLEAKRQKLLELETKASVYKVGDFVIYAWGDCDIVGKILAVNRDRYGVVHISIWRCDFDCRRNHSDHAGEQTTINLREIVRCIPAADGNECIEDQLDTLESRLHDTEIQIKNLKALLSEQKPDGDLKV